MSDETKATVVYTVQMERHGEFDAGDGKMDQRFTAWQDIATVTVPVGSKRKTVLREGLKQSGLKPPEDGTAPRLRVLDAESAEIHEPEAHQPPMEWKL